MNQELQQLAAGYAAQLPNDEAAVNEVLARLCFFEAAVMRLSETLRAPTSDEEIATHACVQFALGHILLTGKRLVIEAAEQDRQIAGDPSRPG